MIGITKEIAQQHLDTWLEAEMVIATGQAYQIGSRSLTRANLTEVRNAIEYWANKLQQAESAESGKGRNPAYRAVYRDL